MPTTLPLTALVGLDTAKQALLLLAVEPRLGGLALAAPVGSGKSCLARGFQALLDHGQPFVELPLGADQESLLGGLDIQETLRIGARVARAGMLARAHGGAIYVDGLNLLLDSSANVLLAALESGEVQIEREGLSLRAPSRFVLIGSYDPAEGVPRRHLLDRVGLLAVLPSATDAGQRAEVVRRNLGVGSWEFGVGSSSPNSQLPTPNSSWFEELDLLRGLVRAAREQLPLVTIADAQIEQLAAAAVAFGVEGQRADLFAVRAACAAAALELRDAVEQPDLELAVRLVILPRATRMPPADDRQPTADEQPPPQNRKPENREPRTGEPENQEPRTENQELEPQPEHEETEYQTPDPNPQPLAEQVLTALATELPPDLADLPFRALRRGRSGSRGTTSGTRGRHIRSAAGDPRRARIDIAATLRAAAPWQTLRQGDKETRRQGAEVSPGLLVSLSRSLPSARPPISLRGDDLRVKHFRSKAGALFLFAVDASGSMALNRMRQAKGAVHALLQQAYVHRDRVALLAFRGAEASVLLPPSQSVELARRALDMLPTGGGTPLAAALLQSIEVARQARGRGILQTVLVLLTDGRANVGLRAVGGTQLDVQAELQQLSRQVAAAGIHALVVDTQRAYLSRGEASRLAAWLGGTYIYLPNANGASIAARATAAIDAR